MSNDTSTPKTDAHLTSELAAQREAYRDEHSRRLQLQKAVQERDALVARLREVLAALLAHADRISENGGGWWMVQRQAREVLAATPETASAELAGSPTDEPDANGSVYARLRWWKDRNDELSDELAALREDKARFTTLAELLEDTNIGDIDPTQHVRVGGTWSDAWREAIDAARREATP